MAVGSVVRHLLFRSTGGEDLARRASCNLFEVRSVLRESTYAARHGQTAITGIHHEVDVLGGNQIGGLAQSRHADGGGIVVRLIGVGGDDETDLPAVLERAGRSVPGGKK